jgi:hypothetical protein
VLLPLAGALLGGCSEYDVAHSELVDEAESTEQTLAAGESWTVNLEMEADAAALGGNPSSWVDITVFALRLDGVPMVSTTAAAESAEATVTASDFLEMVVQQPLEACSDPDVDGPVATVRPNGTCVVELPVALEVGDGSASLQLNVHFQLDFPRNEAPGTVALTIVE